MARLSDPELARLRRSVILLGIAGILFCISSLAHLLQTGSLQWVDIVLPLWGLLFFSYWRRYRAAMRTGGR